jgi:hypothetical protein
MAIKPKIFLIYCEGARFSVIRALCFRVTFRWTFRFIAMGGSVFFLLIVWLRQDPEIQPIIYLSAATYYRWNIG